MRLDSSGASSISNLIRMDWRGSETPNCKLPLLQIVFMKALESPGLFWRKVLNSTQGKRSSTAWFFQCLYWCQWKLILPRRNEAAKGGVVGASYDGNSKMVFTLLGDLSVDCPVSGRTNLYRVSWFHRSSSVYFMRAVVGTGASQSLCPIKPRWAFRQKVPLL